MAIRIIESYGRHRRYRSSHDSSLEENRFEISVPRCLATANSVGAFRVSGGSLSRRNSSIGLPRPTTARVIPPRRLSTGLNPTEASKPLPIWRGTEISNLFSSSAESATKISPLDLEVVELVPLLVAYELSVWNL